MPVFSKILLRTKISGAVIEADLDNREVVFGNTEKCIFVRDYDGELHVFGKINDDDDTDKCVWSAEKTLREIHSGGLTNYIFGEEPTGLINSINNIYTTQHKFMNNTLEVFLNGIRLEPGTGDDYSVSGDQHFIILCYPPISGDMIRVNYLKK